MDKHDSGPVMPEEQPVEQPVEAFFVEHSKYRCEECIAFRRRGYTYSDGTKKLDAFGLCTLEPPTVVGEVVRQPVVRISDWCLQWDNGKQDET